MNKNGNATGLVRTSFTDFPKVINFFKLLVSDKGSHFKLFVLEKNEETLRTLEILEC